jgi:hypothetical protein
MKFMLTTICERKIQSRAVFCRDRAGHKLAYEQTNDGNWEVITKITGGKYGAIYSL